jgi:hypothetical protein
MIVVFSPSFLLPLALALSWNVCEVKNIIKKCDKKLKKPNNKNGSIDLMKMAISNSNADNKTNAEKDLPNYLKICLLIVATSFLAFSIYWAVREPFFLYDLIGFFSGPYFRNSPLNLLLFAFQEFGAAIGLFVNLIAAIFAFQCTILFMKNDKKWLKTLGMALLFEALWFILLIPTSIHHIVGAPLSFWYTDIYVGLSYLLQVLLIVPPFIMLGNNLIRPKKHASIRKWISIAAPLFVLGFWFKYLFLWIDTLSPLGPQQVNLMSTVGAANSLLTLLIASIVTAVACLAFYQKKKVNKWSVGIAIILFGSYFIIYDLVSIWVPVYSSFLYLTDFWMITLPILGIAVLFDSKYSTNT